MGDEFRRYLQTRISLDDPPVVLPGLDRRRARHLARRLAALDPAELRPEGGGEPGEAPGEARGEPPGGSPGPRERAGGGDPGSGPAAERGQASLPSEQVERLAREATAEEIAELPDMESLRAVAEACTRCPLHEQRQQVVFGEGDPDADVVCVGEAPGAREDETGRPFVGPAGQLLDRLLLAVGFRRHEVYICNVLKSRPPNNRDPRDEEIQACAPYLLRQIALIDPAVIVAFGAFAARTLLGVSESLGRLRAQTHLFEGYPLVATYHPAALLRNRSWTRPTWEDLQLARRVAEGEAGHDAAEQLGLM